MKIFVLTGAGISAESGIATFRAKDGLWENNRIEDVATPDAFTRDPERVLAFYDSRRKGAAEARPNPGHQALAELAAHHEVTLVTQNVDGLHEAAGSPEVIHMHGQLDRALCSACGHSWDAPETMAPAFVCPECGGAGRPDIVWFGEMPYHMDIIEERLHDADLFAAIGTSGQVYPAAGFVQAARDWDIETVELNLEATNPDAFDTVIEGPASVTVPQWVAKLTQAS